MEHLNKIIGKTISDIFIDQGTYYALKLEKLETESLPQIVHEITLVIQDYSLTISNKITLPTSIENINLFLGKTIKSVIESDEEVKIITTDDNWLSIDLRQEAFVGPEAMSLTGPNNLCVVWN